jgi:hypothetical protein
VASTRHVAPIAVVCFGALAALAAFVYYTRSIRPMHQVGTAQAWTVLQTVEAEHRGDADHDSALLLANADHSRYTLLGLPTGSARLPRAWIILNQWSPGARMKMIPANAHIHVNCGYVEQLIGSADVEPAVKSFLRARCVTGSVASR